MQVPKIRKSITGMNITDGKNQIVKENLSIPESYSENDLTKLSIKVNKRYFF